MVIVCTEASDAVDVITPLPSTEICNSLAVVILGASLDWVELHDLIQTGLALEVFLALIGEGIVWNLSLCSPYCAKR